MDRLFYKNDVIPEGLDFTEGCAFLIDKPMEWTSFDVVNKLRNAIKIGCGIKRIKVGHTGTLDPLATGLLIVCVGRYTKLIGELQNVDKEYIGKIKVGATTNTYDAEGEEEEISSYEHLTNDEILKCAEQFLGKQEQFPPIYSAVKIKGKAAYKYARKGQEVELKPRSIRIDTFHIDKIDLPLIDFTVGCSKGTYIRSLAHDYGKKLGVGGYLFYLRRTKVGDEHVDNAWSISDLCDWFYSKRER